MNAEVLADFVLLEKAGSASNLFTDLQTIRVLIYTDDPLQVTETSDFGVKLLRQFIDAHQPAFAKIEIAPLLSRDTDFFSESGHAKNLLTDPLLSGFDQVWFFGIHRANLTQFTTDSQINYRFRGGPRSELLPDEVASLKAWMKTGGVLVAGDHAEDTPSFITTVPSDLPKTLVLGRALGNKVPRAHQLRTWENGPTSDPSNSYNTQEPDGTLDLNDLKLESDPKPQRLILARFDGKHPHQLFIAADGSEIDVFPDHAHEGKIGIPGSFDGDWEGTPKPVVVAYSTDKRTPPAIYNLVIAYDGDADGVGRVVAHSTWHHFLNINLMGFDSDPTSTTKGSVADRIGQYYSNLAYWLAPLSKRQAMSQSMFWWLANHPLLMEEASSDPLRIGTVALTLLRKVATPFEIQELLLAHTPPGIRAQRDSIHFPAEGNALDALPSQELLLGSVINRYYQNAATVAEVAAVAKESISTNGSGAPKVIRSGLADGFSAKARMLAEAQAAAAAYLDQFI